MVAPQKNREIAFHLLYSSDFLPDQMEDAIPMLMQHHKVTKKSVFAALEQLTQVRLHLSEIDQMIAEAAVDYPLDRIPKVERNLLRLGIYELYFSKEIPAKVAISEAIRLTRKFATAESARFVNGILDALYKKQQSNAI